MWPGADNSSPLLAKGQEQSCGHQTAADCGIVVHPYGVNEHQNKYIYIYIYTVYICILYMNGSVHRRGAWGRRRGLAGAWPWGGMCVCTNMINDDLSNHTQNINERSSIRANTSQAIYAPIELCYLKPKTIPGSTCTLWHKRFAQNNEKHKVRRRPICLKSNSPKLKEWFAPANK